MITPIATFSIVAYNPIRQEWGVAVQSKFLAAGAVVSWAKAGVGAIATQAHANIMYGPVGLDLLEKSLPADVVVNQLITADDERNYRQIGMVDWNGRSAAYTGTECKAWSGHIIEEGFTCQGNILTPNTIEAMAECFSKLRNGPGELADWLVEALEAGQNAGGDRRGQQAAGVLVVRENAGYGGNNDRYLDLRVDDDPEPIKKLKKLVELHHFYFGDVETRDLVPLSDFPYEIQQLCDRLGLYDGPMTGTLDEATKKSFYSLVGIENLEKRWNGKNDFIEKKVIDFLLRKYK